MVENNARPAKCSHQKAKREDGAGDITTLNCSKIIP
jgi:hypothetical protein